jgi:hypothetical protein
MPMEPDTPFYRRWSFLLAGVIGIAAVVALLGWQGLSDVDSSPTTVTTVPATTQPPPPTTAPRPSNESTSKPADILWQRVDSNESSVRSGGFRAPSVWRIVWAFDCSNFAKHGGGNFKITGNGAFQGIQIDAHNVQGGGTEPLTRGGYGQLNVETVCDQWTVRALSG